MLWLLMALLTASVLWRVILPLRRAQPRSLRRDDRRSIYRDQLAQLPDEIKRGLLEAGQGAAAQLEIERRLLAAALAEETTEQIHAAPVRGAITVALAAAVSGASFALYLTLGSPTLDEASVAARGIESQTAESGERPQPPKLVAAAAALAKNLEAGEGSVEDWRRLAQMQAELGRWQDSAASYRRLIAAFGGAPEDEASYGEVLVLAAKGIVTPAARTIFVGALARDAGNMSARYYLALADAQAGKPAAAIEGWRRLEADAPRDALWLPTLRQQIVQTAAAAGIELPKQAPSAPTKPPQAVASTAPGPTSTDVEAAMAMPAEQRQAMIRSMVERLAARLETSPDDFEGWQRLARAYAVLGEKAKSAQAAARAATLRPDSHSLLEAAQAVLVAEGTEDPRVPLPPSFVSLLKRVLALDPTQADALWYLGLAEAQQKNLEGAADYWRRLVVALPADSERRKTVGEALAALE